MCLPVMPLVAGALAVGSMAMGAVQGAQQASAANAAFEHQTQQAETQAAAERQYQEELVDENEAQRAENEVRAIRQYHYQTLTEEQRLQQLRDVLAEDTQELHRQGLVARGQAAAAAASKGASGQSVRLALQDVRAQEGRMRTELEQQFRMEEAGVEQRREGYEIELAQNRAAVGEYIPAPIHMNTPISPGLSTAGGALMGGLSSGLNVGAQFAIPYVSSKLKVG